MIRWLGVVRLVMPTLLDESAHRRAEAVLGIPFEQIVDLWAEFAVWQAAARGRGLDDSGARA